MLYLLTALVTAAATTAVLTRRRRRGHRTQGGDYPARADVAALQHRRRNTFDNDATLDGKMSDPFEISL